MSNKFKLSNAIFFQLGWFICVLSNNAVSLGFTLAFVIFNFLSLYRANKNLSLLPEISWLLLSVALGFICETVFFNSGLLQLTAAAAEPIADKLILPPFWLLCLWVMFALTLRTSLSFLFNKPFLTCALALLVAPCNYYAGANLNSQVDIGQPLALNLGLIGLSWAFALGSLIAIHHFFFKIPT